MKTKKKVRVTFDAPITLWQTLKQAANAEDVSVSDVIRRTLRESLQKTERPTT